MYLSALLLLAAAGSSLTLHLSEGNRAVILGGGFGGLYSALKTAEKHPDLDVTLIDAKVREFEVSLDKV